MAWMSEIWRRLAKLFRGDSAARELAEEMRLHRESRERELIEDGVGAEEARYAAGGALWKVTALRWRGRDAWGWRWLEDFAHDLRFGMRMLRKNGDSRSPRF